MILRWMGGTLLAFVAQLWQTSTALAEIDAGLAQLPDAVAGMEPAIDTVNRSLARAGGTTG